MVYRLPNGKKLDEKEIFIAMTDDNIFNHYFLDVETGKVKLISEEFDIEPGELLKEVKKKNQQYFEIPKISEKERHTWMKDFVEDMIREKSLRKKLNFILGKSRSFQLFEKVLYRDSSGWIWGWVEGKRFELFERLGQWLENIDIGIDVEEEWEYDDHCPICQAMKMAEEKGRNLTMEELKEAFKKARQKGGFVGGEWFEDPLSK